MLFQIKIIADEGEVIVDGLGRQSAFAVLVVQFLIVNLAVLGCALRRALRQPIDRVRESAIRDVLCLVCLTEPAGPKALILGNNRPAANSGTPGP